MIERGGECVRRGGRVCGECMREGGKCVRGGGRVCGGRDAKVGKHR